MTRKEMWAKEFSEKLTNGEYGPTGDPYAFSFLQGFDLAKEMLAEKMDKDCYDQECGFSSTDIERFGEEKV